MISGILTKVFGSRNERLLKTYDRNVERINALESQIAALSDEALKAKTGEFRQRLANGETLDDLLPEAFAVVREAAKRTLVMRHFDVQLVGGMVLHAGKIAEMRTGEGKTLAATLPAYLNALAGKGVHIVTVNDYLAARDADWMGKVYRFLGLTVGVILSQQATEEKRVAYAADITYGTNNEFGFDYLRDNMEYAIADRRQRGLSYAIVDEVDSILIDEARTPLIISGPAEDHTETYVRVNEIPKLLNRQADEKGEGDYWVDEKAHQVHISEAGHERLEEILTRMGMLAEGESLYSPSNIILMHHLNAALRAHSLFHRDQQYVVQNGEIIIVDEFTGRMMVGRRWSEGLHQAVEAKEGVPIQAENQTYASITFQNYFRMYGKLAGMTGTADTEAYEFQEIYRLETVVIPTHRPMIRIDSQDKVYRTLKEKYTAILDDIKDCVERGQPVLVGTTSIENSELLSNLLQKEKLPHQVLNAKQHAKEAEIIAQAGSPAVITIATNMAGRGTDIVLGGNVEKQVQFVEADAALDDAEKSQRIDKLRNEWQSLHDKVVGAGGLKIIGSERHESRRIDNQLRGRSGRQGDPGASRFYLSMEDSLLRIFAGDKMKAIMDRLKLPEGEAIEAGMVTRSIESAQRKVEARNFDIRKQLLEYDDVANDQRREIYRLRNEILETDNTGEMVTNLRSGYFTDMFRAHVPLESVEEQWDIAGLEAALANDWQLNVHLKSALESNDSLTDEDLLAKVLKAADESYEAKVAIVGRDSFSGFERSIMLQSLDQAWREHLTALDALRQGIHLRGYVQKQPKQEYKREAFELFGSLLDRVRADVVRVLMNVRIQTQEEIQQAEQQIEEESERRAEHARAQHSEFGLGVSEEPVEVAALTLSEPEESAAKPAVQQVRRIGEKIGRNDPCPCGSGKKYKQCHGKL
ncbi:MAG TPA: preprotein translocase subunit SecA [Burkholderiaceae bacterium]|nr:preprotein translocase subunit SecA [Burkholderiaceae bacterium]